MPPSPTPLSRTVSFNAGMFCGNPVDDDDDDGMAVDEPPAAQHPKVPPDSVPESQTLQGQHRWTKVLVSATVFRRRGPRLT